MKKTIALKLALNILCLGLIILFFFSDFYKIDNIGFKLYQMKDWFNIFLVIIPVLFSLSEGLIKNKDIKCLINIVLIILGLVFVLLICMKDYSLSYGFFISLGIYFVLGIISGIRLSKVKKSMLERQRSFQQQETRKMMEDLMKNDKFKK